MDRKPGSLIQTIRTGLLAMSRPVKQGVMFCADAGSAIACSAIAFWLAVPTALVPQLDPLAQIAIVVASILVLATSNAFAGLYRSVIRFLGSSLYLTSLQTTALTATAAGLIAMGFFPFIVAIKFATVFWAFLFISTSGSRFVAQKFLNKRRRDKRERVLIYGAGAGGVRLASALSEGDHYLPVMFVDDSRQLWGKFVGGLEVHPALHLKRLVTNNQISQVLLALPSISRKRKRRILEKLVEMPVHVQTMPEVADIVAGRARVDDIRDVDVEDLLGRDSVPPNPELLQACVTNKTVMVTGAGGSIGSELCRQILDLAPKTLILFEISEVALYQIDRQLRERVADREKAPNVIPLIGSVHHRDRVRQILAEFDVQTVYHAAAYKHVPLVEQNVVDGVHNNAFGTLHTARAALDAGVETFVLVSTDKAVSPTNVMGATKRFAELVLQALHHKNADIRFCMVRFGNVLASSGSVVPLFKEQIRNGGPVTVTHPEIIRYFMTIPEAAQLVIQAGSMAKGGDVFVLDMGKPVKILDLARRMISLMGLSVQDDDNPEGDIEISFTGLRPAEKLYEELLIGTDVSGTEHPRILRANESYLTPDELNPLIDELWTACRSLDTRLARDVLLRAVEEYKPTNDIEDLVWGRRQAREQADNVTPLAAYRDPS